MLHLLIFKTQDYDTGLPQKIIKIKKKKEKRKISNKQFKLPPKRKRSTNQTQSRWKEENKKNQRGNKYKQIKNNRKKINKTKKYLVFKEILL